jgi:pimeloyl-ACP methyl ester carboxylesterase
VPPLAIGEVSTGSAAGGVFWRIGTPRGAVLAWRPAGDQHRTAGVVVYLHGYFTTVDQAAADHRLFEQFRASGRSALFIAPEAPAWNGEASVWPDLAALLAEVLRRAGLTPPKGPLVVAAHSGGYRTVLHWLGEPRLEEVLLLDGLYRGEEQLRAWLEADPAGRRRLVLVVDETADRGEALAAAVPGAVLLPRVPPLQPGLEGPARTARLVVIRSQHPHMAIVERGEVLPVLLRATRLPPVR